MSTVSTKQQQIAELAQQSPQMAFTSLAYHMDVEWLREAYRQTRKDGAAGVDGVTAADNEEDLQGNLQRLLDRAKSGTYHAPPVRRVHIPKGTGTETRPIGIPTLEDKVLQRAIVMLLEPIYEEDFSESSFGFRPRRSAHQALEAIWERASAGTGGWILEVDIRKFFDTLDHGQLRDFLRHRIRDGVVLRLIGKWLKAGVLEDGNVSSPETGSPQGGVISPLLANVYLHYVLDQWFAQEVRPRLNGRAWLVRYADDFVMGFTHHWGRSRRGHWIVQRRTAAPRLRRTLRAMSDWCRRHRHLPVREQQRKLNQKLQGHDAYYGITGNYLRLKALRRLVERFWRKWLNRRNRERSLTWPIFRRLLPQYPLVPARVVHSSYGRR